MVKGVSKTFAGTRALRDVSLSITPATVHALLGGNGSGKSTLIKILAGVYHADPGGTLSVSGRQVAAHETSPSLARGMGLRFVHQDPGLVLDLTVAENVALANGFSTSFGRVRWRELHARTLVLLDRFGIEAAPDQKIGDLRAADRTMIAVARALEDDSEGLSTLVLDEPTAALPKLEVEKLIAAIRNCAAAGQTIVFVSHRIDEVLAIADVVTVLRDGENVITRPAEGLSKGELIEHIMGRPFHVDALESTGPRAPKGRAPVLRVRRLRGGPVIDASFDVVAGEVVGIAGLLGSGRTEILRMIFGALAREAGDLDLAGQTMEAKSTAEPMARGVAYVPEDRGPDAAFPELTVRENLSTVVLGRYWRAPRFQHRAERADAEADIERFGIRTTGDGAPFASLSGGNQQKVVLARWLRRKPRLLLLDEPTAGIDVGARADVYALIRTEVDRGLAVIVVSSDFDELSQVCDRVLVLREGRIAAEQRAPDLTPQILTGLVYTSGDQAA